MNGKSRFQNRNFPSGAVFMRKLELFLKRIFNFPLGRAKRERVWEKEFLPALAFRFRFFRRRRISFFALRKAPPFVVALAPNPPVCGQQLCSLLIITYFGIFYNRIY